MAVVGGLSLSAWEHSRSTKDVDILLALEDVSSHSLLARLGAAGFRAKRSDPWVRLKDAEFLQLLYEPPGSFLEVQVDLLMADSLFQKQALQRRVVLPLVELGFDVAVLACEDLVLIEDCASNAPGYSLSSAA
jgi:hypothetical protein